MTSAASHSADPAFPTRRVVLLSLCQALLWSAIITGISFTGLVGQALAPDPALATLPIALLAIGMAVVSGPASLFMARHGRRAGFLVGAVAGGIGWLVSCAAVFAESFWLLCAGHLILGLYQSFGQYYRLAATDGTSPTQRGRAVSLVLAGAIVAAVVAPWIAGWSKDLFAPVLFAGAYLVVAFLAAGATLPLLLLPDAGDTAGPRAVAMPASRSAAAVEPAPAPPVRPLGDILRQPAFLAAVANNAVGFGVMTLVMVATPLSMVACGFTGAESSTVIGYHVLGMFVPALFSGMLVDRFGAPAIGLAGTGILAASVLLAASSLDYLAFAGSTVLLGVGWNFMIVSGTTLLTTVHTDAERGKVQGIGEMTVGAVSATASLGSGGLLAWFDWTGVNLGALPLLAIAGAITLWFQLRRTGSGATPAPA